MAQEDGYTRMLVTLLNNNVTSEITKWVEDHFLKESNITPQNKTSFYEAERYLLSEYIDRGLHEKFYKLFNAIHNEKFDQEYKNHPYYLKLKANECKVLAGAIIESKRYLEDDYSMHKDLGNLLYTKYQALKSIGYDVKQITTVDTALAIVHYSDKTAEVQISGANTNDVDNV